MKSEMLKNKLRSVAVNTLLVAIGSFLFAFGIKAVAVPHDLISGGLFGLGLVFHYLFGGLDPSHYFLIFNIPLFLAGYLFVSRRFFLYSLLAVVLTTIFYDLVHFELAVQSDLYAALAAGFISGGGVGITLRSLGSGGGLDIVAVIIHNRWGISFGRFSMTYHFVLFVVCFAFFDIDRCITSLIMIFVSAIIMDEVISGFSKRKVVRIISPSVDEISREISSHLKRGSTFIQAYGAYSGEERRILMTVINPIQLKRLEKLVFEIDEDALFIVENTFSVLGRGFSRRRTY